MSILNNLDPNSAERIRLESMCVEIAEREYDTLGDREIIDILVNGCPGVSSLSKESIIGFHQDLFPERYPEETVSEYELPRPHRAE